MNRQNCSPLRTANLVTLLVVAGCATPRPAQVAEPEAPTPRVSAGADEAKLVEDVAVVPPPRKTEIPCVLRAASGQPVAAHASMDEGAPLAFEATDGMKGIVLGSAAFTKNGRAFTYYEIQTDIGRGWIYEKNVVVMPAEISASSESGTSPHERAGLLVDVEISEVNRESDAVANSSLPPMAGARAPDMRRASNAPDVLVINEPGAQVDIAAHLVKGQYTIVDFYSEFCGPCREIAPRLENLAEENRFVVLRKIDINRPGARGIDWRSPVAIQYGLSSIPHVRVYGPDGTLEGTGAEAWSRIAQLEREL